MENGGKAKEILSGGEDFCIDSIKIVYHSKEK